MLDTLFTLSPEVPLYNLYRVHWPYITTQTTTGNADKTFSVDLTYISSCSIYLQESFYRVPRFLKCYNCAEKNSVKTTRDDTALYTFHPYTAITKSV